MYYIYAWWLSDISKLFMINQSLSYVSFLTQCAFPTQANKANVSHSRTLQHTCIHQINHKITAHNYVIILNGFCHVHQEIFLHGFCCEYRSVHRNSAKVSCKWYHKSNSSGRLALRTCQRCSMGTWTWWHLNSKAEIKLLPSACCRTTSMQCMRITWHLLSGLQYSSTECYHFILYIASGL